MCVCGGGGGGGGYLQCVLKMMDQLNWWKDDPEEQLDAGVKLNAGAQLDVEEQLGEQALCPTWLV